MVKITVKNKSIIQFCFSNPQVIEAREEINGITFKEMEALKSKLRAVYGEDWFRFFLALKPATLNKAIGVE